MDINQILSLWAMRIKELRLEVNETQRRLAQRAGIPEKALRRMEQANGGVPVEYWVRVLVCLGRSAELKRFMLDQLSLFEAPPVRIARRASPARRRAESRQTGQ